MIIMETFDPKVVYLVTFLVDDIEQPEPRIMTDVRLREPGPPEPEGASYYLTFGEMADGPRSGGFYVVGEPVSTTDGIEVYDRLAIRSTHKPAKRRFTALTRDNFERLADFMENWTYLDRVLKTTADIQYFYREEILG